MTENFKYSTFLQSTRMSLLNNMDDSWFCLFKFHFDCNESGFKYNNEGIVAKFGITTSRPIFKNELKHHSLKSTK